MRAFMHTYRVKQICPLLIPVLQSEIQDYNKEARDQIDQEFVLDKLKVVHAKLGLSYNMYPKETSNFDSTDVIEMNKKLHNQSQTLNQETLLTAKQLANKLLEEKTREAMKETVQLDPFNDVTEEPQILFLGTSSMKPGNYRGASAIYYVSEQRGVLMDCAEGSYGQIFDHFGNKAKTDEVLLKTRAIFITHIHGDHQLGIIKILQERDQLMDIEGNKQYGKIFAVIPTPLFHYIQVFVEENIKHKDMVTLIKSLDMNPENNFYYQKYNHYQHLED